MTTTKTRRRQGVRAARLGALGAVGVVAAAGLTLPSWSGASAAPALLSQGKAITASSSENPDYLAAKFADDGDLGTRWASKATDNEWLQVNLGSRQALGQITLTWEAAYAKSFKLQGSNDGVTFTDLTQATSGVNGAQTVTVSGSYQYVRMQGLTRATGYGYSLWEFQVFAGAAVDPTPTTCGTTNAAIGKAASASSVENADYTPAKAAFDGNAGTRWSSQPNDDQWLQVNLGSSQPVCKVTLTWEAAYAKTFKLQGSNNGTTFSDISAVTAGVNGTQTVPVSGSYQYVRMQGLTRATGYGYSLWEMAVNVGSGGSTTGPTPTPTPTPTTTPTPTPTPTTTPTGPTGPGLPTSDTPDLGSNVAIFDPTMSKATIQTKLDEVFNAQKENQFGDRRDALLFKPGNYGNIATNDGADGVYANIGFNTSILGLGLSPDDVTINGAVTVDAFNASEAGNATQNFWRSAENLSINPIGGTDRWGVSQAAPFRRIHVKGSLDLFPNGCGWSSGGYIADSVVDGQTSSCSQQQFYTRDSNLGFNLKPKQVPWDGSNWNMVFSGVVNAPAQSFPNPKYTTLDTTPVSREKPFLYIDGAGKYRVFVPSLRTNARGASWVSGTTAGSSLPMSTFYVAKPGVSAATLNQALAAGQNLFFTPGVYHLNETLNVTKADTVVLGIGYATLIPDNGVVGMTVADVDGVKIAGLLFDAGTTNSSSLMTVGASRSTVSHAANPTTVQDTYFRVGGGVAGKATNSLIVNSSNVIIDHTWAWRADHGSGVGWNLNTADNGVVVNGDNVLATGLFVEHYQKWNVLWNGNGGRTIFYQNEMPYDPPNQAAWMSTPTTNGYAAYKVAPSVTTHEAWGLGSYILTLNDRSMHSARAFEVPDTAGVKMHDMVTVSLGNVGIIDHVINNTGPVTPTNSTPASVTSYP